MELVFGFVFRLVKEEGLEVRRGRVSLGYSLVFVIGSIDFYQGRELCWVFVCLYGEVVFIISY